MEEKVMKITPLFDYVLSVQESSRCPLQAGKAMNMTVDSSYICLSKCFKKYPNCSSKKTL